MLLLAPLLLLFAPVPEAIRRERKWWRAERILAHTKRAEKKERLPLRFLQPGEYNDLLIL